jgi:hypothetical protein
MSLLRVTNIVPQSGSIVNISGSALSASLAISASAFYGDGSNLSGVTAEWDGSHNGNAEITGSLTITQQLTLGSSDQHQQHISGSLYLHSGLVNVETTNKLEVHDGTIDDIHSSPQFLSRDIKIPDATNCLMIGPVVTVQTGSLITVGSGSILTVNP